MPSLTCSAQYCTHNKNNCCCISNIHVNGKKSDDSEDTSCGNFIQHIGAVQLNESACSNLSIDCDAQKCVYNKQKVCLADRVDIGGIDAHENKRTECSTFRME